MNKEQFFNRLINEHGINLTNIQKNQFNKYYKLVIEWNKKINLTAITGEEEFYTKHFYDSISLAFYRDYNDIENICDVGSGAGFPSIPLKIIYPHLKVTIIDSLNKRIKFLELLKEELNLENCHFIHARAEEAGQNKKYRESFEIVTARAVARLNVLAELCLPLVKTGGYFLSLKAQKADEEVSEAINTFKVLGGKLEKDINFKIAGEERHILEIRKVKETPNKYPRKAGIPNKKPLM
ncbi:16S rRNA methyltransferase GidB [Gemella bergeri ATCC 700627]|uniref:Ribosomal RNA small subunit methyltransferase G n=1 Tax=Gemella bergeri ATCC 700627 TaxID=1321820 RepID=U2QB42_9BACL|nr:16S rRNA (guanine(527)-N(7))-methyltransferase RsmG [Gemella bergeri]ERK60045.1 16S rRNA methyltransferase GidB [Gemella bergeri ATCC 700627]